MSVVSYKCPNCGGELTFDPKTQKFQCEYCMSSFNQKEMEEENPQANQSGDQEAVVYSCPSCGAEVVTDQTTAATFCYYCHNPVILKGRLSGAFLPEKVLPFQIDRKEAEARFMEDLQAKKFVPRSFFDKKQIDTMTGVYFPYWMCEYAIDGEMEAKATDVRIWRVGDIEYTETKFYHVERGGNLEFSDYTKNALKKANHQLVEGVQPFPFQKCKDFSMSYLSGFQAEKRDMERGSLEGEVEQEMRKYTTDVLRGSISGYTSVSPKKTDIRIKETKWHYVLLPVWTLTYKGKDGKIYYYAMNGITRKVCGKLPLDSGKLVLLFVSVFVPALLLCLLGGYLL